MQPTKSAPAAEPQTVRRHAEQAIGGEVFHAINNWVKGRSYRKLAFNRVRAALFPLTRRTVDKMFSGLHAVADIVQDGHKAGVSPEVTAITLLTAVMPGQFAAIASPERRTVVLAALEEALNGPVQSVAAVLFTPSGDPLVTLVRNLVYRTGGWVIQGLVDQQAAQLLLDEISGALRGLALSERSVERLTGALLDAVLDVAQRNLTHDVRLRDH